MQKKLILKGLATLVQTNNTQTDIQVEVSVNIGASITIISLISIDIEGLS